MITRERGLAGAVVELTVFFFDVGSRRSGRSPGARRRRGAARQDGAGRDRPRSECPRMRASDVPRRHERELGVGPRRSDRRDAAAGGRIASAAPSSFAFAHHLAARGFEERRGVGGDPLQDIGRIRGPVDSNRAPDPRHSSVTPSDSAGTNAATGEISCSSSSTTSRLDPSRVAGAGTYRVRCGPLRQYRPRKNPLTNA